MTNIKVQYFALLREEAKTDEETLSVECKTYGDLYDHLQKLHNFSLPKSMIQVAVDDEFAKLSQPITPGSRVVFIPPVAGG